MSESDRNEHDAGPRADGSQAPIPRNVLRRERRMVAGLLATIALLALIGFATIPTEAELVETASTHANSKTRVAAMNAMIRRGYWSDKSFKSFERFNKAGPHELRQFLADMHGNLLKSHRRAWTK